MFIGHLPAGYIVSDIICKIGEEKIVSRKACIMWGMLGSVVPDLDMICFYLWDDRRYHHHTYATHFPVVWIVLIIMALFWLKCGNKLKYAQAAALFTINGMFHLCLDSIVGDIYWLAPFGDKAYALFTVPALYQPWWLNFMMHWSFGVEIVIALWGYCLWQGNSGAVVKPEIVTTNGGYAETIPRNGRQEGRPEKQ